MAMGRKAVENMRQHGRYYEAFNQTGMYIHSNLNNFLTNMNAVHFYTNVERILKSVVKNQEAREDKIKKELGLNSIHDLHKEIQSSDSDKFIQLMTKTLEEIKELKNTEVMSEEIIKKIVSTQTYSTKTANDVNKITTEIQTKMDIMVKELEKADEEMKIFVTNGMTLEKSTYLGNVLDTIKKSMVRHYQKGDSKTFKQNYIKRTTAQRAGMSEQYKSLELKIIGAVAAEKMINDWIARLSEDAYGQMINSSIYEALTSEDVVNVGTKRNRYGATYKSDLTKTFKMPESELTVGYSVKNYRTGDVKRGFDVAIHKTTIPNIIASMSPTNNELRTKSKKAMEGRRQRKEQFGQFYLPYKQVNQLVYLIINTAYMATYGAKVNSKSDFMPVGANSRAMNFINEALNAGAALWFGQILDGELSGQDGHVDFLVINGEIITMSSVYNKLLKALQQKNSLLHIGNLTTSSTISENKLYQAKLDYIKDKKSTNAESAIKYRDLSKVPDVRYAALQSYTNLPEVTIKYKYR